MKGLFSSSVFPAFCLCSLVASAQTDLPRITVTAPLYTSRHGGYLISGDFKVDPRMPYVAFPAQALVKDDILSVEPVHLADDDYLVVQECATADCSLARIVRVWDSGGALTNTKNSENRIWIRHENKYFIWVKRLPSPSAALACDGCSTHFTSFEPVSPPLTLIASGAMSQFYQAELTTAENAPPLLVEKQAHEGSTFVVTYAGGSTVRIRRMHSMK
jgi:hypothetical protein